MTEKEAQMSSALGTVDWQKGFPVASICREDLTSLGFTREQIVLLTDEDLEHIAFAMEDMYCDQGYWEDLEECTKRLLEEKAIETADEVVVFSYTLEQAIADGTLVEIFKDRWPELADGKPVVATAHLFHERSQGALQEIWNQYIAWKKQVEAMLPEDERLFTTTMHGKRVWVMEDDQAHTLMYPEDY
jgi:hypothetical protein